MELRVELRGVKMVGGSFEIDGVVEKVCCREGVGKLEFRRKCDLSL